MAATVTALDGRRPAPSRRSGLRAVVGPSVRAAVDTFLDSPNLNPAVNGSANTARAYANVLDRIAQHLGPGRALAELGDDEIGETLTELWGSARPATWNRRRRFLPDLVRPKAELDRADAARRSRASARTQRRDQGRLALAH